MLEIRQILCPVDFSDHSRRALDHAIAIARWYEAAVTVLHVFSPAPVAAMGPGPMVVAHEFEYTPGLDYAGMTVGEFLKEREEAHQRQLQEVVAGAPEFCRAESLMTHGKPWREVLRVAEEKQSDLIVMGVQGRGAADLLFFGSTTQHVVREASCPVLTLRHA
jgi:nucleotide-binding universal stress UspA family protein